MAWATAALIGSACDTATTVWPGWAARRRSTAPADARLHLGERLAAGEPEAAGVALHGAPLGLLVELLQLGARPLAEVGLEQALVAPHPQPERLGDRRRRLLRALERRGVHRGDLALVGLQGGDALGDASRPAAGPSRRGAGPAARPGRTLPVVGVWPWRTNSTSVGGGGVVARAMTRGQPIVGPRGSVPGGGPARCVQDEVVALPRVPPAGGLAGAGRRREAGRLPRRGLLGPARPGLRRPGRPGRDRGPGPGRPRRQPHRPHVHRRPLRRLPLRVAAPHRLRQPADEHRTATTASRLTGAWITAPVRCAPPANKPTPAERDTCRPFLERELALLDARVLVPLGGFAYEGLCRILGVAPRPEVRPRRRGRRCGDGRWIVGSYHVSQQNTFTGKLTEPMLDAVFDRPATSPGPDRPTSCSRIVRHADVLVQGRRRCGQLVRARISPAA